MASLQSWVSDHKLAGPGAVFASAVGAKLVYARSRAPPHGRSSGLLLLTCAVLSGVALRQYYEFTDSVLERVPDFPPAADLPEGYFDPVTDW